MNRSLPLLWLGAQFLLATVLFFQLGKLSPQWAIDSGSYADFPLDDLKLGLRQVRTAGYPLFLSCDLSGDGSFRAVPAMQLIVHFAAVTLFFAALRAWQYPAGVASLIATSLLWSNCLFRYVQMLTPDCVAHSLAVMAIGWTLILVRRRNGWTLFALAATLFATYQTRPAYLFLIPAIPALTIPLDWLSSRSSWRFAASFRRACGVALWTITPLIAFAAFRWWVVGSFGLVSFGGYNAAGVFGQFIDESSLAELPAAVQPISERALEYRHQVYAELDLPEDVTTSYITIEQRFDASTWRVFVPAARDVVEQQGFDRDDAVAVNGELSALARGVVVARPRYYAVWLLKAAARGTYILFSELIVNVWFFLLLVAAAAIHFHGVYVRRSEEQASTLHDPGYLTPLLTIALVFSISSLALIIITTPPLSRFVDPAGVFWPAALAAAVAGQWSRLHGSRT